MLYRHGLRVSELCRIKLEQLNLDQATIFVKRSKNGIDGMHPIAGDEHIEEEGGPVAYVTAWLRSLDDGKPKQLSLF